MRSGVAQRADKAQGARDTVVARSSGARAAHAGRRYHWRAVPDDDTKTAIHQAGGGRVSGTFRLCRDATRTVESVLPLRSTGFASYDRDILAAMQRWRYSPYMIDGKGVPVCTSIAFVYTQR